MDESATVALPKNAPEKRRRFLQFRIRTMLLLTAVVAVWIGLHCQAAKQQRESRAAMERLGGWVYYDYQFPGGNFSASATSPVPQWLRDALGEDFFHSVVEVNLVYNDRVPQRLDNAQVSDEALRYLGAFPKLRNLLLKGTQATDEGLRHVGQLNRLETLYMWDATAVSDAGIAHLRGLKRLRTIHCNRSKITDESLRILATLPALEELSLQENRFTNAGLEHLQAMHRLRRLWVGLGASGITDDGMVYLQGLTQLEQLDLQKSQVTSAGLARLKGLKRLKVIFAEGTKVDDRHCLEQDLPNCQISK